MFWNPIFREFRGVLHFSTVFLPSLNRHGFRPPFTEHFIFLFFKLIL
jgi:hypothetical protein